MLPERWLLPLLLPLLAACATEPDTGPKAVKWDRDSCERCRMVLSDRHFAAQVRYLPAGKQRSKVLFFDDIGCATLWLEDRHWKDQAGTEIWVSDHRGGDWIDARKAYYLKDLQTPMAYGLGAQREAAGGALNFEQAKAYVRVLEEGNQAHGIHLLERLKEQELRRRGKGAAQPPPSTNTGN